MATGEKFMRSCPTCRTMITMQDVKHDEFIVCPECAAFLKLNASPRGIWLRTLKEGDLADVPGFELIHTLYFLQGMVRAKRNAA